jgi:hypothetical protein
MKKTITLIACIIGLTFITGCTEDKNSADSIQAEQTKEAMVEAQRQVGMPAIVNYRERKMMKSIFELRDKNDLICYAYIFSEMTGKYTFLGKCIGYGLPYSVQFTNPERVRKVRGATGSYLDTVTVPQPDPNGLFMPEGLSATWLALINPETGDPQVVYVEPLITVSPFPLPSTVVQQ